MCNFKRVSGILVLLTAWSPAFAIVNFAEFTVTQVISPESLQLASGTSTTARVAGIAAYPEVDGPLYAMHVDDTDHLTVLRVQTHAEGASWLTDAIDVSTRLGTPYQQRLRPVAGMDYDTGSDSIFIADDFNGTAGDASLIKINATTGVPAVIRRDSEVAAFGDFAALPGGNVVATRPGARDVAVLQSNGALATAVSEAELMSAAPGKANLIPAVVATVAGDGTAFLYCSGDGALFSIADVDTIAPAVTYHNYPELAAVEFADIAVDQQDNLYGLDSAGNRLVVIRASDDAVFSVALSEIATATASASAFEVTPASGLTARSAGRGQTDLFIASSTGDHGVVRVRFGGQTASVHGWELYD